MEKENRIDTFDVAKGIGIISIIIGHLGVVEINRIVFTYHVPLFFIISGYFLRILDIRSLAIKKAKQLLIPYVVTCVGICIGSFFSCIFTDGSWAEELKTWVIASLYGAGDSWEWPFDIHAIGAIWFLWALFWGFLIADFCLQKVGVGIVLAIAITYLGIATSDVIWLPFSIQAGCTASLYLLSGYGARKYNVFPVYKGIHLYIAILVWIYSIWNFRGFWLVHNYFGNGILDFLGSFCAVYVIIYLSSCIKAYGRKLSSFLRFFGKNSLYILCFHLLELNLCPWSFVCSKMESIGIYGVTQLFLIVILKLLFASVGVLFIKFINKKLIS